MERTGRAGADVPGPAPRHAFAVDRRSSAERPRTPDASYGVPEHGGQLMPWDFVAGRLTDARAYWLSTVDPASRPAVMPVWGVYLEEDLFLETSPATRKARNLEKNRAVAVHLDDDERVVVIEGVAEALVPDAALGATLATAFAAKYRGYDPAPSEWDGGGLYRVLPQTVFAWRDMPTATRWRFSVT